MPAALIVGFLFGFFGSMPLAGPISVLVFSRGIEGRLKRAFSIGIGASFAEAIYAFLAFLGFAAFLADYEFVLPLSRALAAVILVALGVSFMRGRKAGDTESAVPDRRKDRGAKGALVLGFTVTALNPTLVGTWTAATTMLYSTGLLRFEEAMALPFAFGVLVGDLLWYGTMVAVTGRHCGNFKPATQKRIQQACGLFLVVMGIGFVYLLKAGS